MKRSGTRRLRQRSKNGIGTLRKVDFMKQVSIGIHTHEQPEQLHATLESVHRNTESSAQLILLPDGPDWAMSQALQRLVNLPQFATEEPSGAAACFNRLAVVSAADVVV